MEVVQDSVQVVAESIKQYYRVQMVEKEIIANTAETFQNLINEMKDLLDEISANYMVEEQEGGIIKFMIESCELYMRIDQSIDGGLALPPDYQRIFNGDKLLCGSILIYRKDNHTEKFHLIKRLLINEEGKISSQFENTRFEEGDKLTVIAQNVIRDTLTVKTKKCYPKCSEISEVDTL